MLSAGRLIHLQYMSLASAFTNGISHMIDLRLSSLRSAKPILGLLQ